MVQMPKIDGNRILRIDEVVELTGLSRSTIYRMERERQFPRHLVLGSRGIGWRYKDVEKWIKRLEPG